MRLKLEPFDRVVLVYGIQWRPRQYIDAARLIALVPHGANPFQVVVDSLERLEGTGFIELRRRRANVRFRRTASGFELGNRLFRDCRVSFLNALADR